MPLEDPNTIDMSITDENDYPILIITDSGMTSDPEERLRLLRAKLLTYAQYIVSDEFRNDHSAADPARVRVQILCQAPPTADMQKIDQFEIHGGNSMSVPVSFEVFPG